MHRPITVFIILIALLLSTGFGQNRMFDSEEIITIKIETPLSELIADRSEEAPDQPVVISYKVGKEKIIIDGEIAVRGNYRRRPDICPFPPLKLKIKKEERAGTIFEAQKKIKLVTHCQGEEYLMREYMIYKFYNMLTPYSYKVRLIKVQYRDRDKGMPGMTAYAFLIESDKALKERLGGKLISEDAQIPSAEVAHDQLTLLHMFQFMIGNLDWGITQRKNMSLLKLEANQEIMPIPYDFDFAACVQAPYTGLEKGFERRYYRNICRTRAEYETLFEFLRSKRSKMEELFMTFDLIPKSKRQEALGYISEFFSIIEDEQKIEDIFLSSCPSR
ncbi:MAG: hypothetical protein R8P61_21960 [Bacteroidia bacterium]|nr:hypothetical protein [Bacteroidia bacterium]